MVESATSVRAVPYPARRTYAALPAFAGSASPRPDPAVQAQVEAYIVEQYGLGRSLRVWPRRPIAVSARCARSSIDMRCRADR
jgi:hypothetical protein